MRKGEWNRKVKFQGKRIGMQKFRYEKVEKCTSVKLNHLEKRLVQKR